ncbi:MAG: T9SS type A sorting domain-containing protein, partial [Sphingobacteriales bacterium]
NGLSFTGNFVKNAGRRSVYMHSVNYNTTPSSPSIIANNMIAGGIQNGTVGDGMYLNFVKHLGIYHNSVLLDNAASGYAFAVTTLQSRFLDVRNNSFTYLGGGNGYAMAIGASIQDYTSDYNNLYSNGKLARTGNTDRLTLTDLSGGYNAAGPLDLNSISQNPMYQSNTDLHLNVASPLITNEVPMIAAVTTDFDGQNRQAMTAIGADEVNVGPRVASSDLDVNVYPNPFRTELKVAIKGAEGMVQLTLVDMMGRRIFSQQVDAANLITLQPQVQLSEGVYMLQVTHNGTTSQYRVVKQ